MLNRSLFTFFFACCLIASDGIAQGAYWVIESNIHTSDTTIVKVYDSSNQLIAQTHVIGKVDITRKRDRRMLNKIVRNSVKDPAGVIARKPRRSTRAGA